MLSLVRCLVRVTIARMKHHDQKQLWGGKDVFGLLFHIIVDQRKSGQEVKQDRSPETGADTEAMEKRHLPTCPS